MTSLQSQGSSTTPGRLDRVTSQSSYASSWTDDLPVCYESGVGFSTNQIYREDGHRLEEHEFEDRCCHFRQDDCYLYGVFDGHDGSKASNFAFQRMPAELLLGQLQDKTDEQEIKDVLKQAFLIVENGYFETIAEILAEKTQLELQMLPEGVSEPSFVVVGNRSGVSGRLGELTQGIQGGTTAVLALIYNNMLYTANVGDSRVLLCKEDENHRLRVKQLSTDHTVDNPFELQRLIDLGLDGSKLRQSGTIGKMEYTRSIGDYPVKGGYKDIELLRNATSEPVIAEPDIIGGYPLEGIRGFLLLMSDGLYKSYQQATGKQKVNAEIAAMVCREFATQTTLNGIAQSVVDKVVRLHHDAFMTGTPEQKALTQKRDDMTLLVRNFGYPLPNAVGSPTHAGGTMPASVPYHGHVGEPLHLTIPTNRTIMSVRTNGTISSTLTGSYSNSSNEDSNRGSGEQRFHSTRRSLPLDDKGMIEAYVDFSDYFRALEGMTQEEREQFEEEMKIRPTYEPIKEEIEKSESSSSLTEQTASHDDGIAEEPKTPDDEISAPLV